MDKSTEELDALLDKVLQAGNGIAGAAMPPQPDKAYIDKRQKKAKKHLATLRKHLPQAKLEQLSLVELKLDELAEKAQELGTTIMGRVGETGRLNIALEELVRPLLSDYDPDLAE